MEKIFASRYDADTITAKETNMIRKELVQYLKVSHHLVVGDDGAKPNLIITL